MPPSIKKRQFSVSVSKQDELLNVQTQYYVKPEDMKLTDKQKLKKFVWNPQENKIFGRTGVSWCKMLFY